jgi:hypothetical protein
VWQFYASVAEIFERWVTRRESPHTQRAYRRDVMSLVQFLGIDWPEQAAGELCQRPIRSGLFGPATRAITPAFPGFSPWYPWV